MISSPSIDPAHIELVNINMRLFAVLMPIFYGPRYAGLEVHMLKHVAQDVLEFGPVWTHSMFVLEHMGGRSVLTCHSKKTGIAHSIFQHFLVMHNHRTLTLSLRLTDNHNILLLYCCSVSFTTLTSHKNCENTF
jgi:hypothetical protein